MKSFTEERDCVYSRRLDREDRNVDILTVDGVWLFLFDATAVLLSERMIPTAMFAFCLCVPLPVVSTSGIYTPQKLRAVVMALLVLIPFFVCGTQHIPLSCRVPSIPAPYILTHGGVDHH